MTDKTYLPLAIREFRRLQTLAEKAMGQITPEQFFAMPAAIDNSIAIIVKHVAGNLASRWTDFLTSDGEKPWRNRDAEFELTPTDTHQTLMRSWEAGWKTLFSALEPLTEAELERGVAIRGESLTVLEAITRQLTHYAYHVGQIVYVARHYAGDAWRTLSIAKGKSAEFNAKPQKYLERP